MATSKDTQLANDIIAQQVDMLRFTAGEKTRVLAILKRMEEDLIDKLLNKNLTDLGRADLARLLTQAQGLIEASYGEVSDEMAKSMLGLAHVAADGTIAALETAFEGRIVPQLPTTNYFKHLVRDTMIRGAPNAEWWERQAADVTHRFRVEVAQGLAQAETNDQIIRRIRGKAAGYKIVDGKRVYEYVGGVMNAARANAAAQVQTATATVAAQTRRETFSENDDVLKGVRQVSTLDGHTTLICVGYSGGSWNNKRQPIPPTTLAYAGGVPRHWNCRSVEVPITKTFKELGIDIPEFAPTTRAASGGPLSAKIEFEDFLNKKGKAFTDELLGPGRADLWRSGKITLQQLLDQSGNPLTLDQLQKKYG